MIPTPRPTAYPTPSPTTPALACAEREGPYDLVFAPSSGGNKTQTIRWQASDQRRRALSLFQVYGGLVKGDPGARAREALERRVVADRTYDVEVDEEGLHRVATGAGLGVTGDKRLDSLIWSLRGQLKAIVEERGYEHVVRAFERHALRFKLTHKSGVHSDGLAPEDDNPPKVSFVPGEATAGPGAMRHARLTTAKELDARGGAAEAARGARDEPRSEDDEDRDEATSRANRTRGRNARGVKVDDRGEPNDPRAHALRVVEDDAATDITIWWRRRHQHFYRHHPEVRRGTERRVRPERVRSLMDRRDPSIIEVGDRVEARPKRGGARRPGHVVAVHRDGTCDVRFRSDARGPLVEFGVVNFRGFVRALTSLGIKTGGETMSARVAALFAYFERVTLDAHADPSVPFKAASEADDALLRARLSGRVDYRELLAFLWADDPSTWRVRATEPAWCRAEAARDAAGRPVDGGWRRRTADDAETLRRALAKDAERELARVARELEQIAREDRAFEARRASRFETAPGESALALAIERDDHATAARLLGAGATATREDERNSRSADMRALVREARSRECETETDRQEQKEEYREAQRRRLRRKALEVERDRQNKIIEFGAASERRRLKGLREAAALQLIETNSHKRLASSWRGLTAASGSFLPPDGPKKWERLHKMTSWDDFAHEDDNRAAELRSFISETDEKLERLTEKRRGELERAPRQPSNVAPPFYPHGDERWEDERFVPPPPPPDPAPPGRARASDDDEDHGERAAGLARTDRRYSAAFASQSARGHDLTAAVDRRAKWKDPFRTDFVEPPIARADEPRGRGAADATRGATYRQALGDSEANPWRGGGAAWRPGRVTEAHSDGTFSVRFDNGVQEHYVESQYIRPRELRTRVKERPRERAAIESDALDRVARDGAPDRPQVDEADEPVSDRVRVGDLVRARCRADSAALREARPKPATAALAVARGDLAGRANPGRGDRRVSFVRGVEGTPLVDDRGARPPAEPAVADFYADDRYEKSRLSAYSHFAQAPVINRIVDMTSAPDAVTSAQPVGSDGDDSADDVFDTVRRPARAVATGLRYEDAGRFVPPDETRGGARAPTRVHDGENVLFATVDRLVGRAGSDGARASPDAGGGFRQTQWRARDDAYVAAPQDADPVTFGPPPPASWRAAAPPGAARDARASLSEVTNFAASRRLAKPERSTRWGEPQLAPALHTADGRAFELRDYYSTDSEFAKRVPHEDRIQAVRAYARGGQGWDDNDNLARVGLN